MTDGPIVIAGASGFVGSALVTHWRAQGREIIRLVRRTPQSKDERHWDPSQQMCDPQIFSSASAVINLSGASVADGRWTSKRKALLRSSRLDSTRCLVATLKASDNAQCRYIAASGVGYYGDSDQLHVESDPVGSGFLANLCQEWEAVSYDLEQSHAATQLRLGAVLGAEGGALQKMLTPMKWCVGGRLGSGRQWMSWIALKDLVAVFDFLLAHRECHGPINAVAPEPIRNADFLKTLAQVMGKPYWAHVPAWVLRLIFGQMAQEVLLQHNRACPKMLQDAGFVFRFPDLESCFKDIRGVNDATE